jgi:hypothetical protein
LKICPTQVDPVLGFAAAVGLSPQQNDFLSSLGATSEGIPKEM